MGYFTLWFQLLVSAPLPTDSVPGGDQGGAYVLMRSRIHPVNKANSIYLGDPPTSRNLWGSRGCPKPSLSAPMNVG